MCPSLLSFFFLKGNSPFYLLFFFFSIEVKNQRSRISAAVSRSLSAPRVAPPWRLSSLPAGLLPGALTLVACVLCSILFVLLVFFELFYFAGRVAAPGR